MPDGINIIAFSGSSRKGSLNKKVVAAALPYLKQAGAEVTYLDLKEYSLPLYDGDNEENQGLPEKVQKLKAIFEQADGFFISSPEYNGYFSGVLKNLIDWLSRPAEGKPSLECFLGKTAAVTAASPGGLGGIRALPHIRTLLSNIKVHVIPEQLSVGNASKAFQEDGTLISDSQAKALESVCRQLVDVTRALKK